MLLNIARSPGAVITLIYIACLFTGTTQAEIQKEHQKEIRWEVVDFGFNLTKVEPATGITCSTILGKQPLYISITTIKSRVNYASKVILSIMEGILIPTHIYLIISEEPYMLDEGIKKGDIPLVLQHLSASTDFFSVIVTENIGPHRKLLPILQHYWDDDCVIVTFDDDLIVKKDTLFQLVAQYIDHNKEAVVGLRTRRIGFCSNNHDYNDIGHSNYKNDNNDTNDDNDKKYGYDNNNKNNNSNNNNKKKQKIMDDQKIYHKINQTRLTINPTSSIKLVNYDFALLPRIQNSKKEMLVIPTGNRGVLYRPRFFHPIVLDPILRALTMSNDDLTFRLATISKGIYVVNGCCTPLDIYQSEFTKGTNNALVPLIDNYTDFRNDLQSSYSSIMRLKTVDFEYMNFTDLTLAIKSIASKNNVKKGNNKKKSVVKTTIGKNTPPPLIPKMTKDLYSKNIYWNTDIWLAGVAYLKLRNIINVNNFYSLEFLYGDRQGCLQKGGNDFEKHSRKDMKSSKENAIRNHVNNNVNNNADKNNSLTNGMSNSYTVKNVRSCGIFPSCSGLHYQNI